jgi:predicted alpha/beta-hydrolase family hydrolase
MSSPWRGRRHAARVDGERLAERGARCYQFPTWKKVASGPTRRGGGAGRRARGRCGGPRGLCRITAVAGGKSFGSRMTSRRRRSALDGVGLAFFGFPLHPAESLPSAKHRRRENPMLFLRGTRDSAAVAA